MANTPAPRPSIHGTPAAGSKHISVGKWASTHHLGLYRHPALHGHRRSPLAKGATKDPWKHKGEGKA